MAKISNMKPKSGRTYSLLFGDDKRGYVVAQTHAAVIQSGTQLEKYMASLIPKNKITTIDNVSRGIKGTSNIEIAIKPKRPRSGETKAIIPDFGVFYHQESKFEIIELKLGDTFDTQKSAKIKENLQSVTDYISQRTGYTGEFYLCSFGAEIIDDLLVGLKKYFSEDQVMLFDELCLRLGIDYEEVLDHFIEDQRDNDDYYDDMNEKIRDGIDDNTFFQIVRERRTKQFRLFYDED